MLKLKNEGGPDSLEEEEYSKLDDEVEPMTLALRSFDQVRRQDERYSPPDFHSTFVISAINDEPRSIR